MDKKVALLTPRLLSFAFFSRMLLLVFFCLAHYYASFHENLVCYTAVFRVVTQRSSQLERCVMTLKTAVKQTNENPEDRKIVKLSIGDFY